jgi:MbtH protein
VNDDIQYQVLANEEEQFSLWPASHEVPAGWRSLGKVGTKQECMSYVDEVWTDMRPRSLRDHMDAQNQS